MDEHVDGRAIQLGYLFAGEFVRRAVADQGAVHAGDGARLAQDGPDVVRHKHDGHAPVAVEITENGVQLLFARDVHAGRWFVQHEQLGLTNERAGQQHPLLLADRKLGQTPTHAAGHAHRLQGLHDVRALGPAEQRQRSDATVCAMGHRLGHGDREVAPRPGEHLRHVAHAVPVAEVRRIASKEPHGARGRSQQPESHPNQRALAAAVRT